MHLDPATLESVAFYLKSFGYFPHKAIIIKELCYDLDAKIQKDHVLSNLMQTVSVVPATQSVRSLRHDLAKQIFEKEGFTLYAKGSYITESSKCTLINQRHAKCDVFARRSN